MANSKWLDYEGLEYYTKKLDAKLEDYAKTSDLSNYVTSSTLSTELGAYLPLTGGTLTGDLKVDAKFYLKECEAAERAYVFSCNDDGEVVMTLWSELDEKWLSGSKKRTVYGDMTLVNKLTVQGTTTLALTENDSAENVVVADSSGNLYKMAASALSSGGIANGVYIAYTDSNYAGHIALPSEYDGSGTVCGVLVVEGSKQLLIAPEETSLPWWSANSGTPDVLTTTTTTNAAQDFDGKENTKILYDWGITSTSYAAGYCYAYSHGTIPATKWWLPALGEVIIMRRYYSDINSALSVIGGTSLSTGYHWSSTAYSSNLAWSAYVSTSSTTPYNKTTSLRVRPVSAFHFVEQL